MLALVLAHLILGEGAPRRTPRLALGLPWVHINASLACDDTIALRVLFCSLLSGTYGGD